MVHLLIMQSFWQMSLESRQRTLAIQTILRMQTCSFILEVYMEKVRICIIGGGSRLWAIQFLKDLTLQDKVGAHVVLYDIDRKAADNNEAVANEIFRINGKSDSLSVSVADTLGEGLDGAAFVIIAIEPGITDIRKYDLGFPEEYGILQSVGDTTGPGGIMRARRALPLFFDFAREIEKHAPDAWVINYTNPLTLCTAALYKAYPGIKALGCCHEVFHTETFIAEFLAEKRGIAVPDRREIDIDVSGLNHFTFITKARYKGEDVMPLLGMSVQEPAGLSVADIGWIPVERTAELPDRNILRRVGTIVYLPFQAGHRCGNCRTA